MLIAFDGIDGCGKSTQVNNVSKILKDFGYDVMCTRDPGNTKVSESIRNILLDKSNNTMHNSTEFFLFLAAKIQNYQEIILPALKKGIIVLTDRYILSTYVYQILGKDIKNDLNTTDKKLFELVNDSCSIPNINFIFNIPLDVSFNRISQKNKDRMESTGKDYFVKISQLFNNLSIHIDLPIYNINANQPEDIVTKDIIQYLSGWDLFKRIKK